MHARAEEALGKLCDLGLHVLGQGQRYRPAARGIGEDVDRRGQARHELLGARDAIPVTGDRTKAIVGRDGGIAEVLHLLEDGIRLAAREDVAGEEQNWKTIDVGDGRRRHHVRGARADRRRAGQDPPASMSFGEGDGRVSHRLLVVRPEGRKLGARAVERLPETGDVAVAEDREHARHEWKLDALDLRPLGTEISDERLGHRELMSVRCARLRAESWGIL